MKTNRYIVIALLLSIFVSSCEDGFLKQDPQTSLSNADPACIAMEKAGCLPYTSAEPTIHPAPAVR